MKAAMTCGHLLPMGFTQKHYSSLSHHEIMLNFLPSCRVFFLQALLHGISKLLCVDKIGEPPVPPSEPSVLPQLLGSRQDSGPLHHCTSEPAPMTRTSGAEQHHNISKLLKIGSPLNRIQGSFMID